MKNLILYYDVGALLYCPANSKTIADSLINEKFGNKFSLALCLEDTINDNFVKEAESILIDTINTIFNSSKNKLFFIPKIFIRVREPKQIINLLNRFQESQEIIKGFIIPKFDIDNADEYISIISDINKNSSKIKYIMPIIESPSIINLKERYNILYVLKQKLDSIEKFVLNIRVGGNDLCHIFGFRRHVNESIHKITPISNIFSDIVTTFGTNYIISGPVWEYYNCKNWDSGLKNEIEDDKLCGFIGKTVIHPKQIDIVNNSFKVTEKDVKDAEAILNWNTNSNSFVSGSVFGERMNEYKTHCNWASKILIMKEVFGVK